MTRARRRKSRSRTEDAEWLRRREYVMASHAGDSLAECVEFWEREPAIPADLRADPLRWRHLLAPPERAEVILAVRARLLEARRAWLIERNDRR